MDVASEEILARLPGKDCGQCGFPSCAALAEFARSHPQAIRRCVHLPVPGVAAPAEAALRAEDITWQDLLGHDYDFVLEAFAEDRGPREVILPIKPATCSAGASRRATCCSAAPPRSAAP